MAISTLELMIAASKSADLKASVTLKGEKGVPVTLICQDYPDKAYSWHLTMNGLPNALTIDETHARMVIAACPVRVC
jgi:hypothetical protein